MTLSFFSPCPSVLGGLLFTESCTETGGGRDRLSCKNGTETALPWAPEI